MNSKIGLNCLILFVVLAGCSAPNPEPGPDIEAIDRGRQVWQAEECGECHGENGGGTDVAPSLRSVADHWAAEDLKSYLFDSESTSSHDQRLAELSHQYELEMPGILLAPPEQVDDLVVYLMNGLP
jgi:mono/diheme cytochrome c family protein